MFKRFIDEHSLSEFSFDAPLLPPAADRAFWQGRQAKDAIEGAEAFLHYDWPIIKATDYIAFKQTGDRLKQEVPSFMRRNALECLLFGEIAEYKGRFLPDLVNGIFAVCEETYWGVSAHWKVWDNSAVPQNIPDAAHPYIDLFAAETASTLVWIRYMLYESLNAYCPEIIDRIDYELRRRILDPYLDHNDFWWMGYGHQINNWNPWILSNILSVILLGNTGRREKQALIRKTLVEIERIYVCYPSDGGCDEGIGYWSVSGASLFEYCDQLYRATNGRINFFQDGKLQKIAYYPYHVYLGNSRYVNFADASPKGDHGNAGPLYQFGERMGDRNLMRFAKEVYKRPEQTTPNRRFVRNNHLRRDLYLLAYENDILSQGAYEPEDAYIYPQLEIATVHGKPFSYAAKGGSNDEGHNHNDVGSFIVYDGTMPVLVDPACGEYTAKTFSAQRYEIWHNRSYWHNLPLVNGCTQPAGPKYRTDSFSLTDKRVDISFAKAYPQEAGLLSLLRTAEVHDGVFTVKDTFIFHKESNTVDAHFITPLEIEVQDNKVILGKKYELACDVPCTVKIEAVDFDGDGKLLRAWEPFTKMHCVIFGMTCGQEVHTTFTLRRIV